MSTPEDNTGRPVDPLMERYLSQDERERGSYQEWLQLDGEDRASARAERQDPEQAYDQYEGSLGPNQWQAERRRDEELERLGIDGPLVPESYASALGVERASALESQVKDAILELARSPRSIEELSAHAQQRVPAGLALNKTISAQVVELEKRREILVESWIEADQRLTELLDAEELGLDGPDGEPVRAEAAAQAADLRQGIHAIGHELEELSAHKRHPDRWRLENGGRFADGLAAQHLLRRELELAKTTPEQASRLADSGTVLRAHGREPAPVRLARETPGAGMDPF
ncbi:MAG: hypothetical protein V7607_2538 [Solirubrobacteraceae bacterium]